MRPVLAWLCISRLRGNRQAIYVKRNTEARSCNHSCSGKVLHILNMFVALGIQHANPTHRIVICGLFGPTIVLHVI